jgi:hypothetical protein
MTRMRLVVVDGDGILAAPLRSSRPWPASSQAGAQILRVARA